MSRSVNLPVDHSALRQSATPPRYSSDIHRSRCGVLFRLLLADCVSPHIGVSAQGGLTWVFHEFVRVSVLLRSVVVRVRVLVLVVMVVRVRSRRGDSSEGRRRDELGGRGHLLWYSSRG